MSQWRCVVWCAIEWSLLNIGSSSCLWMPARGIDRLSKMTRTTVALASPPVVAASVKSGCTPARSHALGDVPLQDQRVSAAEAREHRRVGVPQAVGDLPCRHEARATSASPSNKRGKAVSIPSQAFSTQS
jgi:hypothetical protein